MAATATTITTTITREAAGTTTIVTTISVEATAAATSINQQQSIAQFTSLYSLATPLSLTAPLPLWHATKRSMQVAGAVVSRGKNRFKIYKL